MTDWFRSWHGAPTDPKWRTVARRAGVRPGDVAAVVWALLDRASQSNVRGSVEGYDAEVLADALGYESSEIEAIIAALRDKGVLDGEAFVGWAKYQPAREDGSSERAKAWRERKRTQETKPERPREDTDTDNSEPDGSAEAAPRPVLASPKDRIWAKAPELAVRAGRAESTVRAFLGKVLAEFDPELVEPAVNAAIAEGSGDPCAFITRILKPAANRQRGSPVVNGFQDFDAEALKAARRERAAQRQGTIQ